jgi:hypothetical protein
MKTTSKFGLLIPVALLLILFASGCTKEWKSTSVTYYKATSVDTSSFYNEAKIKLEIATLDASEPLAKLINKRVFNSVCNSVYTGEKITEVKNYDDLVNSFVANYTQIKTELKQDSLPSWEAQASAKINYQSKKSLNITVDYYLFTGGAHGYGATESLLINPENGRTYKLNEVFSNTAKLTQLVEAKFRAQLKVPAKSSLTDAGYFFTDDRFILPKNFILSDKGIQFHYNTYEVACYAQGPIDILISYQDLGELYLLQ